MVAYRNGLDKMDLMYNLSGSSVRKEFLSFLHISELLEIFFLRGAQVIEYFAPREKSMFVKFYVSTPHVDFRSSWLVRLATLELEELSGRMDWIVRG